MESEREAASQLRQLAPDTGQLRQRHWLAMIRLLTHLCGGVTFTPLIFLGI